MKENAPTKGPPRAARLLVRLLVPARHREFILGDLVEDWADHAGRSRWAASLRHWRLAFGSVVACARGQRHVMDPRGRHRQHGGEPVTDFLRDVAHGVRMLRRRPGFAVVAMATLALGIGATTSVFSIADWLLLRPLPGVGDARGLVTIEFQGANATTRTGLSPLNLEDFRQQADLLRGMGASQVVTLHVMTPAGEPSQRFGEAVGGDYFRVLGVRPQLGRFFGAEESAPGRKTWVAVISDDLWAAQFGRDPAVIGRTLRVNGQSFTVAGVAPRPFHGIEKMGRTDVWLPGSLYGEISRWADPDRAAARRTGIYWVAVFGRLAPGATVDAVQAQLRLITERLVAAYPDENEGHTTFVPHVHAGVGQSAMMREYVHRTVRLLLGVVVIVLVIACANVANMLLFRAVERRGEAAVRRALGASGSRLLRQQFAESLALALCGGLLGGATVLGFRAFFSGALIGRMEIGGVRLDHRVLLFSLTLGMLTALLFGLVPTLLSGGGVLSGLREGGLRETARRAWLRSSITVVQLSLSVALLVGALLLTRTLLNLYRVELGFDESNLVSVLLDTQPQGYDAERRSAFERALLDRLRADARLDAATLAYTAPFGVRAGTMVQTPDDPERRIRALWQWASPGYFRTLRVPLLSGRAIEDQDMTASSTGPTSVVISAALAREAFGDQPAIGRTLLMGRQQPVELRVVGVVADTRMSSLAGDPDAILYEPLHAPSRFMPTVTVITRSRLGLAATESVIREAVHALDASLPLTQVEHVSDRIDRSLAEQRLLAQLLVTLAVIALLMAGVGLYGVVSYTVAARTREIGIRVALGARADAVLAMVLRQAAGLAFLGIALGAFFGLALGRVLQSRLFGVGPMDAWTFGGAAAMLALVTLAASALPTRAALRVDPASALRSE